MILSCSNLSNLCNKLLAPVVNLIARIFIGKEFFYSGLGKMDDLETNVEDFEEWFPALSEMVDGLLIEAMAFMAMVAELIFPVLLVIGLFTRLGALGLFSVALVIEVFVFPNTLQHYYWMLILGFLIAYGGNKISLDYWLFRNK